MCHVSPGAFTLGYQGVQGTVHSHAQASGVGTSGGLECENEGTVHLP